MVKNIKKIKDKKMTITNDIRTKFLDYFKKQDHTIVDPSPLIPQNDPTLMFTNSGMVQFKDYLAGTVKPPFPRAATCQKSVRAGGKHNDLDNVGYTLRHHTFFEMLGNFSFGDYFKEKAIYYAWDFLTNELGLDKSKLYMTVYHTDDEAFNLWKKIAGVHDDRIIRIATKDNFWQMGDTGPCGPCSEIFYDHGDKYWGGKPGTPEEDGDRFIEIWNLVFDQFEDLPGGERISTPTPSIDTGSGLERLSAILHGSNDNYAIDVMRSIIETTAGLANVDPDGEHRVSLRVIADHLRSSSFLIADGVLPSNEGRGYVLRRIMRRAMRHIHMLGQKDALMYKLLPELQKQMGVAYPEIIRANALISETLKNEEERFHVMLENGLKLLDEEVKNLSDGEPLSGEVAFKLHDTYGFPLDLTIDALRNKNITVDTEGFKGLMEKQRQQSAWAGTGDSANEAIYKELTKNIPMTQFTGYEEYSSTGKILAIILDDKLTAKLDTTQTASVITNKTPFWATCGGQSGDIGYIKTEHGLFKVSDTVKKLDYTVHIGQLESGSVSAGDMAELNIDIPYRMNTSAHHSATHLLQYALQQVLGNHVAQKGSFVGPDGLRFDFSHTKPLSDEEIEAVENIVNQTILTSKPSDIQTMSLEKAMESGAMALFGEKYGQTVRVVRLDKSVELCGGTHVDNIGKIGVFKIVSQTGVSAGVRRIEAKVGLSAIQFIKNEEKLLWDAINCLKTNINDFSQKVKNIVDQNKELDKKLKEMHKKAAYIGTNPNRVESAKKVGSVNFVSKIVDNLNPKELKSMVDEIKKNLSFGIITLITRFENKASIVVGVTNDLTDKFNAIELVKIGVQELGGQGGGGRADMAQGGGPNIQNTEKAINAIERAIEK